MPACFLAERALDEEYARATLAERELQLRQASILCSGGAARAGLATGPCATACGDAWQTLAAHGGAVQGDEGFEAEATLGGALVQIKADLTARAAAVADAALSLQLSEQAAHGGLWMDHSSAHPDILSQDYVERRF